MAERAELSQWHGLNDLQQRGDAPAAAMARHYSDKEGGGHKYRFLYLFPNCNCIMRQKEINGRKISTIPSMFSVPLYLSSVSALAPFHPSEHST